MLIVGKPNEYLLATGFGGPTPCLILIEFKDPVVKCFDKTIILIDRGFRIFCFIIID